MRIVRRRNRTRGGDREGGQAVVELALLSMVLLLIALGTFDLARLFYYQTAIASAARVGAEVASNHCTIAGSCGLSDAPTSYDFVLQAVDCDATSLSLQPQVSCTPVTSQGGSPCSSTCPSACSHDICVTPSYAPGTTTPVSQPTDVTVYVGYNYTPVSFLLQPFLQSSFNSAWTNGCWPGDPPHTHTLCAAAVGRVS